MYYKGLKGKIDSEVIIPEIPAYATNNGHMFYLVCPSLDYRTQLMSYLKDNGIQTTFHYLPLHSSEYYRDKHDGRELKNCDRFADCLVRLPLFYELSDANIKHVVDKVLEFSLSRK